MPTDTQVNDLKINVLSESQYEQIQSPSDTELYLVPETVDTTPTSGSTNPITSGGVYNALQNIPEQEQSDWNETDNTDPAYIKNKPQNIVSDAGYVHTDNNYTTTEKNKLAGIESGAEANVQSDWNQTNNTADDFIKNKPDLDATLYEEVTYSQLRTKIYNEQLVEGKKYRITDYVTTTRSEQNNDDPSINTFKYKSAKHQFDLVVTATSESALDRVAKAVPHEGDSYFSSEDLNRLTIWYALFGGEVTYDSNYYGTGFIYRMVDTTNNIDCPYDFKNIMFRRKLTNGLLDSQSGTWTWVYTFDSGYGNDYSESCGNNIIKPYIINDEGGDKLMLGDGNVFLGGGWYNNSIGHGSYNNTICSGCTSISIGDDCLGIEFNNLLNGAIVESGCYNLKFSGTSQNVYVAQGVHSADIVLPSNAAYRTTVGRDSSGNIRIYNEDDPQVQANWNESNSSSPSYIQNKPTIPAAQVNSDWNASSGVAQILNKPDLNATLYESVTYSQLVTKISNSQLVKGRKYRITDYVTTTTQSNTSSAGHAFDLVVTAIDVNKLDCKASALLHSGDTYFSTAGADLSKWQIWYDVNNDTTKYAWADSTNGKGVIYRMIDEWGNDCPYDFKNILFTKASTYTMKYTFNKRFSGETTNSDYSFNGQYCYGNVMKRRFTSGKQYLNFNVFLNTFSTSACISNHFDDNCYQNTFGSGCYGNSFGYYCNSNVLGDLSYNNNFGNYCYSITFGDSCNNNIFGNYCSWITSETASNSGTFASSIRNVVFENYNQNIRLKTTGSNFLQNVYIAQGVGSTLSEYIELTLTRNLSYRTTVGLDSSGNIRIYNEDDPASASQAQANWNETSSSSPSYIQNKPTIPAAQVQTDWNATSGMGVLLNKPTIPDSTSDLTNDSGFITINDVPAEVIWFTFSLSGSTYTSSITPSQILTYLESNDKCVLGLYPNSKDTTKKDVYHCMNHTHDTAKNTYSLLFATAKERTLTYFLYDSTVGSWKQSEYPMQAYLIGSGTGQNIKTVNNNSLLGSGNINIPSGDTNVQSDWSQTDNTQDDYIKNKPNLATVATSGSYNDLSNKPTIPSAPVQSNWNETDTSSLAYIKNKPTIPAAQVNSDWNASSGVAQILNKPNLATVATSGSYNDLSNKPTIPDPLPSITNNSGKVLAVNSGESGVEWVRQLPAVTSADNGKILIVDNGAWSAIPLDKLIPQPDVLNFYMPNGGTISLNKTGSPTIVELEYWLDENHRWLIWQPDANGNRSLTLTAEQKVFIRNTSTTSTMFSLGQSHFYNFEFSTITYANGNTNSLLNKVAKNATLSDFCYFRLFDLQTNLRTAPELPSVQLAPNCYRQMFNCSGITKSPYLPAETVATYAMLIMFGGCADLIEIRTAMIDISSHNCIYAWLRDASATGDFYCPAELTIPTGESGIPSGWARHDI